MSGKNWLERDPSQSPGLRRIQEAQQAAAVAKVQAEQQAREAAIAAREVEQRRAEIFARTEQRTSQILPLLKEIRDFANRTRTYPVGPIDNLNLVEGVPQVVERAGIARATRKVVINEEEKLQAPEEGIIFAPRSENFEEIIDLKYGFNGLRRGAGDPIYQMSGTHEATIMHGIRLKIVGSTGEIELLRRKIVRVPSIVIALSGVDLDHDELVDNWVSLPEDVTSRRSILAEAFHDPIVLEDLSSNVDINPTDVVELGDKGPTRASLLEIAKGFLGFK